jgi:hypothetical protein
VWYRTEKRGRGGHHGGTFFRSTVMNHLSSTRALFLASMVFASSAFAGNDINKCVTSSGSVTLTDEACPAGARTIKVISGPAVSEDGQDASAETAARPTIERYTLSRLPMRYATVMRTPQPARGLPLDIATLKTARLNMHLFDNAAQSLKSQRIASLH